MRLIGAESLKDRVSEYAISKDEYERFCKIINAEQTVYDVEKVVEQVGVGTEDVCEWHKVKNGNAYKSNTHAEFYDSRVLDWYRCPYCEKKIKVVE